MWPVASFGCSFLPWRGGGRLSALRMRWCWNGYRGAWDWSAEWCDKIFEPTKVWEIRGSATKVRGRICVARSGSSELCGEVTLTDCWRVGRFNEDLSIVKHKRVHAWVFEARAAYVKPKLYSFKHGSVVWRRLI